MSNPNLSENYHFQLTYANLHRGNKYHFTHDFPLYLPQEQPKETINNSNIIKFGGNKNSHFLSVLNLRWSKFAIGAGPNTQWSPPAASIFQAGRETSTRFPPEACRMTRKTLFLSRFQYLNISFQISRTFCFIHKQFINLRTNIIVGPPMNDHEAALQYILNSNRTFGNVNSYSVSIFHFRDSRDTIGSGPSSPCGTQRRAGGKPSIRFPPETLVKYKRSLFQSIIICTFCFNCD